MDQSSIPSPTIYAQTFYDAPCPPEAQARALLDPLVQFLAARLPYAISLHSRLTIYPMARTAIILSTLDPEGLSSPIQPGQPFALACWDRTLHPGPEAFLFTSLDMPSRQTNAGLAQVDDEASPEAQQEVMPHVLAIFKALRSSRFHASPGPSKLYPEIQVTLESYAALGAVPLPTLNLIQKQPNLVSRDPGTYPKLVFQLPEYSDEERAADQARVDALGLEFASIEPRDYQLVHDNNDIVRLVGIAYIKDQPCLALRRKDNGCLVAWVLVRPDGSVGGLTTLGEFQRKGLAALCVRRVLTDCVLDWKEMHGLRAAPTPWKHADVKRSNDASWGLFVKMGGVEIMRNSWFRIDLRRL